MKPQYNANKIPYNGYYKIYDIYVTHEKLRLLGCYAVRFFAA
jgi:hypothetical protein